MSFTALITFRPEKPFGVGRTAAERHSRIVAGYRAEITDGLPDGVYCYTGACETCDEVQAELISSLHDLGYAGEVAWC